MQLFYKLFGSQIQFEYAVGRRERQGQTGVYLIIGSMAQGTAFRLLKPKFATSDPNYMIMCKPALPLAWQALRVAMESA